MDKILVVEDDSEYANFVKKILINNCAVHHLSNSKDVVDAALQGDLKQYSLIVIDLYLAESNGILLFRKLREILSEYMPISILISERATLDDRLEVFNSNFFDCIDKSLPDEEIKSRILNGIHYAKRFQGHLYADGLRFDLSGQTAMIDDKTLSLTPTEFKILYHIAAFPKGIRKDFLIERVWDTQSVVGQALNVHVHNLNKKIEFSNRKVSVSSNGVVKFKELKNSKKV